MSKKYFTAWTPALNQELQAITGTPQPSRGHTYPLYGLYLSLPMGNVHPLITQPLLPGAKEAYGQRPLQNFNLLEGSCCGIRSE